MSLRRSVILSVTVEGRSQADAARLYGVSEPTVSRWVRRYRSEGDAAFEPASRRPKSSPAKTPDDVVALIIELRRTLTGQGLDAGPHTIGWHLETHHRLSVSVSTIRRYLIAEGLIEPAPKKRPKASLRRFQAALPNEMWQTDTCHVRLASGTDIEVLSWLDDHSRYALNVTAHDVVSADVVVDAFTKTAGQHGYPASVLSDNALYFTTRFAHGGRTSRNRFESLLVDLGITQKHSRPNHPGTCGKVERFQQTLKQWLRARPPAPTLDQLQQQLEAFRDEYNNRRPHRALGRATPAIAYTRLPTTGPNQPGDPELRIRRDRVDTHGKLTVRYNGRLHHIGIGRRHSRTPVLMLIADRDIRIINHTTGEIIRHLTLDPTRNYQPQQQRPEP